MYLLAMHFKHLVGEQDFRFTDEKIEMITKPVNILIHSVTLIYSSNTFIFSLN